MEVELSPPFLVRPKVEIEYILPDTHNEDNDIPRTGEKETPTRERRAKRRACQVIKKHVNALVEVDEESGTRRRGQINLKEDKDDDAWKNESMDSEEDQSDYEEHNRTSRGSNSHTRSPKATKLESGTKKKANVSRKGQGAKRVRKSLTEEQKLKMAESRKAKQKLLKEQKNGDEAKNPKAKRKSLTEDQQQRLQIKRKPLTEEQKQRFKETRKPLSEEQKRKRAEYIRTKRAAMTPEQLEESRRKSRERNSAKRKQQAEEKAKLLQSAKDRDDEDARKLLEQVEREKFESKMKRFLYHHAYTAKMPEEQKAKFRKERYLKNLAKRVNETPEEREERTQRNRLKYMKRRTNMTPEQLAHFRKLGRQSQYKVKQKWLPYSQWSEERKEYHREYTKEKIRLETPEQKRARLDRYKRYQLKKTQLKSLMNSGASREEAENLLRQTRPELFPPPTHRGRPRRVKDDELIGPYVPRQDGRGNRKTVKPPDVSQEELQEYLADPEKWKNNFRLQSNYHVNASDKTDKNSKNVQTSHVNNEYDDGGCLESSNVLNQNSVCSNESPTPEQHLSVLDAKDLHETVEHKYRHRLTSTDKALFSSAEETTIPQRSAVENIELVYKDTTETDCIDNSINDSAYSPEYSVPSSPIPTINDGDEMMIVSEEKQNCIDASSTLNVYPEILNTERTTDTPRDSNSPETSNKTDKSFAVSKHKKIQIRNEEYCCELCGKVYKSKRYYEAHVSEIHGEPNNSKCFTCPNKECTMTFISSVACRIHYRTHLNSNLKQKQKRKRNITSVCPLCHAVFDKLAAFQEHTKIAHSRDYRTTIGSEIKQKCVYCSKDFKQKATLDDHVRRIHLGMSSSCDMCNKKFQSPVKLWRHKVNSHKMADLHPSEVGIKIQTCPYCNEYVFRSMKAHIQKEHPEHIDNFKVDKRKPILKRYHCELCNKTLSKTTRIDHIRRKHPDVVIGNEEDARSSCEICEKKFWTENSLATHILHTHAKRIEFKLDAAIKETGENLAFKPLTCQFCCLNQDDRNMYKLHVVSEHSEDLINLVKTKVEEGKVLDSKDLDRMRGHVWRKNNPWTKRRPKKEPPTLAVAENHKKRKGRSNRLIRNCGRKSTVESMSEEDKNFLERFPNIKWRCPVVVIRLLNESEVRALTMKIKYEVETDE